MLFVFRSGFTGRRDLQKIKPPLSLATPSFIHHLDDQSIFYYYYFVFPLFTLTPSNRRRPKKRVFIFYLLIVTAFRRQLTPRPARARAILHVIINTTTITTTRNRALRCVSIRIYTDLSRPRRSVSGDNATGD